MKDIRQRFVYTENQDVTKEWYLTSKLKDNALKSLRVRKNTFTILDTGEKIEMCKHSMMIPKMGRTDMFYVIMGDKIPTTTFRLVDSGEFDAELKFEAEKHFRGCLIKRLQEIDKAPKYGDITIIEDDEDLIEV